MGVFQQKNLVCKNKQTKPKESCINTFILHVGLLKLRLSLTLRLIGEKSESHDNHTRLVYNSIYDKKLIEQQYHMSQSEMANYMPTAKIMPNLVDDRLFSEVVITTVTHSLAKIQVSLLHLRKTVLRNSTNVIYQGQGSLID